MRILAWLLFLAAAPAAQAQMYKCTEGGKTRYSDKPIPDCKDARSIAPPTTAAPTTKATEPTKAAAQPAKPAARSAAQTSRAALTPEEQVQENRYWESRCRTLREEEQWLQSPRGQKLENHAARLGQVRQSLAACR
jgi:hypothetical protein